MKYHDLRESLGGDDCPPWFVTHKGDAILALTLRTLQNLNIFERVPEVWVGAAHPLPIWGERLVNSGPILVYLAERDSPEFDFYGVFQPIGSSVNPKDLRKALEYPSITEELSRIVYLKRVCDPQISATAR
jgi:hypothetical protein